MKDYCIGIYEKAIPEEYDLYDMLMLSKEAGYDYFEISIDRTDKRIQRLYDDAYIQNAREATEKLGMPIGTICLSALGTYTLGSPNPEHVKRAKDIFEKALKFAKALNIPIIQIPAYDVPKSEPQNEETDTRFLKNLRWLSRCAAREGILIGLENMENDYMDSVEKCMRAIDAVSSPYFKLYADAGNITSAMKISGGSIQADMEKGHGNHLAFHLKETKPGRYGGLFYGEGHAEFEACVEYAYADGVRRYTMEYWYTGNPQWKADLVKAREMCEGWVNRAALKGNEHV